jgi:uncharacterized protein with beta-barrel porin domain
MDNSQGITSQFSEAGLGSFVTESAAPDRESALVGFGLTDTFEGGSLLFINYDAQVQDHYLANSITGGFKIAF